MAYDILVTKHPDNGYSARPLLWPELVLSGKDEAEVLARIRIALADFLAKSHIVRIEVEPAADSSDPWLEYAGIWQDVPDSEWNEYLTAIGEFRAQIDRQTETSDLVPE
jgi:predicted RNase H-like HicB family nuclease